ncbi:MAG TPA: PAS domain S-box protein, partial [Mycobacteriales bacterium]|nr:PAS domain S-box protein [Mycobacteriales bacterium]
GMELAARRSDGVEFPAEISLSAIDTDDGLLVTAAIRDVTDRKKAEAKFRGLLEAAPDAIVCIGPDGRIALVNAQTERLFGYRRAELDGQPVEILVPEAVRPAHPGLRSQYFRNPQQRPMGAGMQLAARRKDGTEFPAEISLSGLDTEDGLLVSAAIRDVTERVESQAERDRFEQQLWEKNVELEKASQAKDGFLASMSHELRTPLNAIIGFTGTLLMELPGPLNPEQTRQLRTVQTSGKHLLSIINDLLDLAKIESGKVQLRLEPVSCLDAIRDVVESLRPLAEGKQLLLATDLPTTDVIATSDQRALGQILINLVNNAIKFTDSGEVRIALHPAGPDTPARITVTDTGQGIPAADRERIFHAFQRSETTTRERTEGTGLGLHISGRLAELLKASLSVTSTVGAGSTFTLSLGD